MMSHLRPKTMNEYKKEKATEKKARIFEIIKEVGKPIKSTEVFSLVEETLRQESKHEFDNLIIEGKIPSQDNEQYWDKLWAKNGIGLRQVQRYLQVLTKEGFLIFKSNHYTVSDIEYPEIKLWAKVWGTDAVLRNEDDLPSLRS